jgi:hypothetical protein
MLGAQQKSRCQGAAASVSGARVPTQDAVEPAPPGHSHRPLGGDAKRRGG